MKGEISYETMGKNIRQVVPYVPGEQPAGDKIVKLNTNENPYPPAPGVKKVLEEMEADRLRKYPDPTASILVKGTGCLLWIKRGSGFRGSRFR